MSFLPTIAASAGLQFRARLWASEMSRGHTGGAFGMNLLSSTGLYDNRDQAAANAFHNARDPGEAAYTVNPNLWCPDLLAQLTCCTIHTDDCGTDYGAAGQCWRHRFGVVAITKRHVVGCGHAFSAAQGTWINGNTTNTPPTRRRFIDVNGHSVDRIQLHQAGGTSGNPNGLPVSDLTVAVLDSDLPNSIYIPKVAPSNFLNELREHERVALSQEWQPASGFFYPQLFTGNQNLPSDNCILFRSKLPGEGSYGLTIVQVISGAGSSISIGVVGETITITAGSATPASAVISAVNAHGGASALTTASGVGGSFTTTGFIVAETAVVTPYTTPSNYSVLNRQMLHIMSGDGGLYAPTNSPDFAYAPYGGDSGTAAFSRLRGELVYRGPVGGEDCISSPRGGLTFAARLNQMIAAADANAIALGRMVSPTGYTVTPYTGSIY